MKVAIIANSALSVVKFRLHLIQTLVSKGNIVYVLCPNDEFVSIIENSGANWGEWNINRASTNPFNELASLIKLFQLVFSIKPDFMICYTIKPNIYGSIIAGILKIKSIAVVTGLGYTFLNNNLTTFISRILYRISFIYPKKILFLNQEDIDEFVNSKIIKRNKTILLPGEGVDINYYQSSKKLKNRFNFLFLGRIMWDKGFRELIEAAKLVKKKYPKVNFNVYGKVGFGNPSDVPLAYINEQVKDGLIFYGGFSDDVKLLLDTSAFLILPSFREGLPVSVLEAASMNVPSIVANVPGCRDIIIDGFNGYVCYVKSAESLATKIIQALELEDQKYEELCANSRMLVTEKYSINKVLECYRNIFKDLDINVEL